MNIVKGEFKDVGINEIDIELVVKKWNHLWIVTEWRRDNSWRIVKYVRKDSPMTSTKLTISYEQAQELIEKLNLKPENPMFGSGFTWRRNVDTEYLDNWRREKAKRKTKVL